MIGHGNPIAPHGDLPGDVHSTAGTVNTPDMLGGGIGFLHRAGRCAAVPRSFRLAVAEGLFSESNFLMKDITFFGLDGVHYLKRQKPTVVNGSPPYAAGCRWTTERIYFRGKWYVPGDTRPGEERTAENAGEWIERPAEWKAWTLRPLFFFDRGPFVPGRLYGIDGVWHQHEPFALYETYHPCPWVLYSIGNETYVGEMHGSEPPVTYLYAPVSLRTPIDPNQPESPRPPRKAQPFRPFGANAFTKLSIGNGGADQGRWAAPGSITVTAYSP